MAAGDHVSLFSFFLGQHSKAEVYELVNGIRLGVFHCFQDVIAGGIADPKMDHDMTSRRYVSLPFGLFVVVVLAAYTANLAAFLSYKPVRIPVRHVSPPPPNPLFTYSSPTPHPPLPPTIACMSMYMHMSYPTS